MSVSLNAEASDLFAGHLMHHCLDETSASQRMIKLLWNLLSSTRRCAVMGSSNHLKDRDRTGRFVLNNLDALRKGHSYKKTEASRWEFQCSGWYRDQKAVVAPHCADVKTAEDLLDKLSYPLKDIFLDALYVHHYRSGNCGELSSNTYYQIWRQRPKEIFRVERVSFQSIDHVFVLVNRPLDATKGDPNSWKGAWIIDPWLDTAYTADQFVPRARKAARICKEEEEALYEIGRLSFPSTYDPETVCLDLNFRADYTFGIHDQVAPDIHDYLPKHIVQEQNSQQTQAAGAVFTKVLDELRAPK